MEYNFTNDSNNDTQEEIKHNFVPAIPSYSLPSYIITLPFSAHTYYLIEIILRIAVTGMMALFGMVANVINGVIFYRQGILSEGSTVSLFGLSVSEFFSCFFNVLSNCYLVVIWFGDDIGSWSWSVEDFYYATSIRPRSIFTQITCWITAYIAIERFISVVFPFKVKQIISPKRSCFIILLIFVATIGLYYPQYARMKLVKMKLPWAPSMWRYINSKFISNSHYTIFLYIHPVALRTASMAIVLFCNIVIMWKVVISTKFRKTSAGVTGSSSSSSRNKDGRSNEKEENKTDQSKNSANPATKINKDTKEQRLLRMMVTICVVFLVCTTPDIFYSYFLYVVGVKFHWFIQETAFAVSTLFEIFNSAVNIFIYYFLSTRYRKELDMCFLRFRSGKKATSTPSTVTSGDSVSSTKVVPSITTKH